MDTIQPLHFMVAAAIQVAANGAAMQEVRLLPFGTHKFRDRDEGFTLRPENAAAVMAASLAYAGAQDIPTDYDHQLVYNTGPGKGGTAEASGWIKNLRIGADGIYGDIEWTAEAAAKISAKKYRYLSPVFGVDKKTNSVTCIYNAALTNTPAIDGLTVLAAATQPKDEKMDLKALAASLSLKADADLEQIIAASKKLAEDLALATATIKTFQTAFGVKENAKNEEIVAAAAQLKEAKTAGEGEIVVSASVIAEMQTEINANRETRIAASIDTAIADGKITPAQRDLYLGMMRKDEAGITALIASAVPVLNNASTTTGQAKTNDKGLSQEQIIAASIAGVSQDEYAATLKAEENS